MGTFLWLTSPFPPLSVKHRDRLEKPEESPNPVLERTFTLLLQPGKVPAINRGAQTGQGKTGRLQPGMHDLEHGAEGNSGGDLGRKISFMGVLSPEPRIWV